MFFSLEDFNAFLYTYIVTPLFLLNGCDDNNNNNNNNNQKTLNTRRYTNITITDANKNKVNIKKFFDISNNVYTLKNECFYEDSYLQTFTIDISNPVVIGDDAFRLCTKLRSVTLGDSVTTIDDDAFTRCYSLSSINIPDKVTSIGDIAFSFCESLTSITIPDSVTTIGKSVFFQCTSLSSVTLPTNTEFKTIGYQAFARCTSLTSINKNKEGKNIIPDSVTTIGKNAFLYCTSLSSVTLPTNTEFKTIGNQAFAECTSLTSITIPDSVTTIVYQAFYDCTSLASVTLGNSVTTIGIKAFYLCDSLTSINKNEEGINIIPNSVTTIGNEAFFKCTDLSSITIPSSVTTIGIKAFLQSGISNMYVTQYTYDNKFGLQNLTKDASGNVMFRGKKMKINILSNTSTSSSTKNYSGLLKNVSQYNITTDQYDTITFYNGGPLTYTDVSNRRMKTNPSIKYVIIQDHTSIGSQAFLDCSNIETIELPSTITDISSNAFNGCTKLQKIVVNDKNKYYTSDKYDILYKYIPLKGTKELIKVPASLKKLSKPQDFKSTYTIDTYTTNIAEYAFYDCSNIQTITIPPLVRTIGKHAFETKGNRLIINMSNFTLYYLNRYYSYKDSNNIYDISFNPSFSTGTTKYTPSSFFGYKDDILNNNILSFDISLNTYFTSGDSSNNELGSLSILNNWNYVKNIIVTNYKSISKEAFKDVSNIKLIALENGTDNSLNTIGPSTFTGCSNLTFILYEEQEQLQKYNNNNNVTIQSVYNTINDLSGNQDASGVFENCSNLLSFSVPLYVPTIPHYAFKNCISLLDINMSPNTKTINEEAFENCSSLTFLDLKDVTTSSNNIIKNTLFLTSINVPNNLDNFELTDLYTLITNNNNSVTSNNITRFNITLESLNKLNKKVSELG